MRHSGRPSGLKLLGKMGVLEPSSESTIKGIGLVEVLGAIGVILPVVLGVWPGVVPWAAVGLALDMVGAAIAHSRRSEWPMVGMNVMLFLMAAYVALQHWGLAAV